ncbi:MAG: DUF456 domain-containing protein [Chloroflexota bacterium]|nr:MAG: DUF456 domain-containing protein [Chloroflexota bacterium]
MDLSTLLQAFLFGLAVVFLLIGIVGVIVPVLPGILLIWLTVLAYAILDGFQSIDWITFTIITLIALATGTADIWMSLFGSKRGGASFLSMVYGVVGAIIGFFALSFVAPLIGSLFGGILGYSAGVLLGEYQKQRDWNLAIRASLGGLAGWGVATVIQFSGGMLILAIFVWQVLKG